MKLVTIIPAFNEAATLERLIKNIPRRTDGVTEVEIVVIDDGSTDGTCEVAEAAGAEVIRHDGNKGVGRAFRTGIQAALERGADIIVNIDGDGQFNPDDIAQLVKPILEGEADFVSCTRFGDPTLEPEMPFLKKKGNLWMTRLIRMLSGFKAVTDVSCGFRAYSRETALRLNLFGDFTYTQECFLDLASKNLRAREVPLRVRGVREYGESRVARNLLSYGCKSFVIITRAFRDTKPLLFFGFLSALLALAGLAQGIFVFLWWLHSGMTTGFKSLLLGSAVCFILAAVMFVLALIADMIGYLRKNQEEMLYTLRAILHRKSK